MFLNAATSKRIWLFLSLYLILKSLTWSYKQWFWTEILKFDYHEIRNLEHPIFLYFRLTILNLSYLQAAMVFSLLFWGSFETYLIFSKKCFASPVSMTRSMKSWAACSRKGSGKIKTKSKTFKLWHILESLPIFLR